MVKSCGRGCERDLCTVLCVGQGEGGARRKKRGTCKVAVLRQVGAVYGSGAPQLFLYPSSSSSPLLTAEIEFLLHSGGVFDFGSWLPPEEIKGSSRKLEVQIFDVLFVDCCDLDQDCCGFG